MEQGQKRRPSTGVLYAAESEPLEGFRRREQTMSFIFVPRDRRGGIEGIGIPTFEHSADQLIHLIVHRHSSFSPAMGVRQP